jgi:hypothetical protein
LKDSGKIKGLDFQECVLKLLKVNSKWENLIDVKNKHI